MRTRWMPFLLAVLSAWPAFAAPHARLATAVVVKIIDGDTLRLHTGTTVRLVGVDTPESKHPRKPVEFWAREATAALRTLALGQQVRIEYYERARSDKYGRTLAYLYLADGRMVNAELVRIGAGFAYTNYPFRYLDRFVALEAQARAVRAGMWAWPDQVRRPAHLGDLKPADPRALALDRPTVRPADAPAPRKAPEAPALILRRGGSGETMADTVYLTPTGKKWHYLSCRTVNQKTVTRTTRSRAEAAGYRPCGICAQ